MVFFLQKALKGVYSLDKYVFLGPVIEKFKYPIG